VIIEPVLVDLVVTVAEQKDKVPLPLQLEREAEPARMTRSDGGEVAVMKNQPHKCATCLPAGRRKYDPSSVHLLATQPFSHPSHTAISCCADASHSSTFLCKILS
jgi:hypothetical protein